MIFTITVEDFGGADEVKKFYDKWNEKFHNELKECWNEDFDDWYSDAINEHIYQLISCVEELPKAINDKLELIDYDNDDDYELSEEVIEIAKESCDDFLNYEDCDEESSNEEKACHEITKILEKYNVTIRGEELGGVWIGYHKIN